MIAAGGCLQDDKKKKKKKKKEKKRKLKEAGDRSVVCGAIRVSFQGLRSNLRLCTCCNVHDLVQVGSSPQKMSDGDPNAGEP